MNIDEYIELKTVIYQICLNYDKNKLVELIELVKRKNKTIGEKENIAINTILYPNDYEILNAYMKDHNITNLSTELGIPRATLVMKIVEYDKYKFGQLIENNVFEPKLIKQSSKFLQTTTPANSLNIDMFKKRG